LKTLFSILTPSSLLLSRPLIKNTKVFANGAFTPEEAEELVSAGTLDGVFFGVPWLTHPDLAKRIRHGKPSDNTPDVKTFYGHPEVPTGEL
jgi:2,4-dienoyl-CoA reductase-like NADH-dependent reductase (Old Yellow Enzyme family)